jgi:hypothetical protein
MIVKKKTGECSVYPVEQWSKAAVFLSARSPLKNKYRILQGSKSFVPSKFHKARFSETGDFLRRLKNLSDILATVSTTMRQLQEGRREIVS